MPSNTERARVQQRAKTMRIKPLTAVLEPSADPQDLWLCAFREASVLSALKKMSDAVALSHHDRP
jgi:hypothetical protein